MTEDFITPQPITIGEILATLRNCSPTASVNLDFAGYCRPTTVSSYRGYYDRPAIGYRHGGYSGDDHVGETTVSELIVELEKATSGRVYEGWKGGDYRYTPDMPLWVDCPGDATGVLIVGVEDDSSVTLRTWMHGWEFYE